MSPTDLLEKYPYFAYAALKAIPNAPDEETRSRLRRIVAVNVGDPADLAEILGLNSESLADLYPGNTPRNVSTVDTIDTFLTHFGSPTPAPTPAIDYLSTLDDRQASESAPAPDDSTSSAIDSFLKAVPPPTPKSTRRKPVATEESPALTESFARILIKNGNYTKALEIIEELNLKNPEKSIYFADQMRFLRKLIINNSKRN
ncbi:MAG: hypothetical protein K2L83_07275 [Muribaculaceae bacterium]|nr:hypothetical protein [Muribaculaceae bacterium]